MLNHNPWDLEVTITEFSLRLATEEEAKSGLTLPNSPKVTQRVEEQLR